MEHTQLVHGALHMDNDPHFQPKDTYRDANNGQLINTGGRNYIYMTSKGNKYSFKLPSDVYIPIGQVEYASGLYIFSTNNNTEAGGLGIISKVEIDKNGIGTSVQVIYDSYDLMFSTKHPIMNENVYIEENEQVARIYWTDNYNPPRVVNVRQKGLPFLDATLLNFTPNVEAGNITYDSSGEGVSGNLLCATNRYTYRLISNKVGFQTAWSQLSVPVFVAPESASYNDGELSSPDFYKDMQGGDLGEETTKGVKLLITGIDELYDEIEVAAFVYDGINIDPDGEIFVKENITSDTMEFVHRGGEELGSVSPNDLLITQARIERVGTMATNKNRLILGDVTETKYIDITKMAQKIEVEHFYYDVLADTQGFPQVDSPGTAKPIYGHAARMAWGLGEKDPSDLTTSDGYPLRKNGIFYNQWYRVKQGHSVRYPAEGGIIYSSEAFFKGQSGATDYAIISGTYDYPVEAYIRIRKYGNEYTNIKLNTDFRDHKGIVINAYLRSFWRGEPYRLGIMLWDVAMRPCFVYWITDYTTPEAYEAWNEGGYTSYREQGNNYVHLNHLGLRLSNINLEHSDILEQLGLDQSTKDKLPNYISGFSIVRAERDGNILMQGILKPTVKRYQYPDSGIPSGLVIPYTDDKGIFPFHYALKVPNSDYPNIISMFERANNTYLFHSPEHLFNYQGKYDEADQPYKPHSRFLKRVADFLGFNKDSMGNDLMVTHIWGKIWGKYKYHSDHVFMATYGGLNSIIASYNAPSDNTAINKYDPDRPDRIFYNSILYPPLSSGSHFFGQCLGCKSRIIVTKDDIDLGLTGENSIIANVYNMVVPNNNPYGGQSESAKANTQYIPIGHFQPINSDVYSKNNNSWIFDDVEVFGGDCFINLFDISRLVRFNDDGVRDKEAEMIIVPLESNVNVALRQGRHVNRDGIYGDEWTDNNGVSYLSPELFKYNEAYSHNSPNVKFPAVPINLIAVQRFKNRATFSSPKIINEQIDNFRVFLIDNYKDLDIQNGAVKNLRVRGENLYYWQEDAMGYLPMEERVTVPTALGTPVQLGIGGVMERYDERTDFYGNQHTHGLIETVDGFVWVDAKNRAILSLKDGGKLVELSTAKGAMSFIDAIVKKIEHDNPIDPELSGIHGIYDTRTKKTYITFKYRDTKSFYRREVGATKATAGIPGGWEDVDIPSGQTISFSYVKNQFIAKHPFIPPIYMKYKDYIFSSPNPVIPITSIADNYNINVGDMVDWNNHIYVCISAFTYTGVEPGQDTTHWKLVNEKHQVFVHEEGDYGQFYGVVYDTDIELIVNVGVDTEKVFDNVEINSGVNAFSKIKYSNSFQEATDQDIQNNKEYRMIGRSWCGSVALEEGARMRDKYLSILLTKDNRANGDPTVSSNKEIKLVSLKTILRKSM